MQTPTLTRDNSVMHFVTESGQAMEISLHQPSPFVSDNLKQILPDWKLPIAWVVLILQRSRFPLDKTVPDVEKEKDRLRENFIHFGLKVAFELRSRGFLSNLFDPRTGYPLLSGPGEIRHDDAAVVKALRGLSVTTNQCSIISHPTWGTAVYPGTLMTSAAPSFTKPILLNLATAQGWKCLKTELLSTQKV